MYVFGERGNFALNKPNMNEDSSNIEKKVLRKQANWEDWYFYPKSNVLYQMTFAFTKRFLQRGDRTIDQMVQAARSGKQNIVEGSADGVTSTEMEIKLLNVARSSITELKEDYEDYLTARHLTRWDKHHARYDGMLQFCRKHNRLEEYEGGLRQMDRRRDCKHRPDTLPHGRQDDDHLSEAVGANLHRRRRYQRANDCRPPGLSHQSARGNSQTKARTGGCLPQNSRTGSKNKGCRN